MSGAIKSVGFVAVTVVAAQSFAAGITILPDVHDSYQSVRVAQLDSSVAGAMRGLEAFVAANLPCDLAGMERVLGQSVGACPDSSFAMPLCQDRVVGIGGLHVRGQRLHCEFYPVADIGGLHVFYNWDWTSVATVVVCLKVDPLFVLFTFNGLSEIIVDQDSVFIRRSRVSRDNIGHRTDWDRSRLDALEAAIRQSSGK